MDRCICDDRNAVLEQLEDVALFIKELVCPFAASRAGKRTSTPVDDLPEIDQGVLGVPPNAPKRPFVPRVVLKESWSSSGLGDTTFAEMSLSDIISEEKEGDNIEEIEKEGEKVEEIITIDSTTEEEASP
uniref:Uncharacterized protein LOC111116569 n=1 Tax=Crassostrea virginica TaxID=6565 RepID=A0A8B8C6E1_CRAVI|nr:uncharacterized protein LOC111116569 [Crassostrea virginica]